MRETCTMHFFKNELSLIFLVLILISFPLQAKIAANLDRQNIYEGETFILDIPMNTNTQAQPDLSMIPRQFKVLSSSKYENNQIINGQQTHTIGWKIKLEPLKVGQMTIPAIKVGKKRTQPIQLNIKATSHELKSHKKLPVIFIDSDADLKTVYVQQQIIYTVAVYVAVNAQQATLSQPTAENSMVEKLGSDERFERTLNNQRYTVTRRRYAIFPQQSGKTEISSVTFAAKVSDHRKQQAIGSFFTPKRAVTLKTPAVKIQVKPKLSNASSFWLPATQVTLTETWSSNKHALKVGEPVTWTIHLSAQGLSEAQLPEIKIPKLNGLQWYYDTPLKKRKINSKGVLGRRTEKLAIIPSKVGKITIPAIQIKWWDIRSQSIKEAILPKKTLKVLPASTTSNTPIANQAQSTLQPLLANQMSPIQSAQAKLTTNAAENKTTKQWQLIAAALFTIWIITCIYFTKKQRDMRHLVEIKRKKQLTPAATNLLSELKTTIKSGNAQAIETSLLQWVQNLGFSNMNSLGALANKLSRQSLKNKIKALEALRYSKSHKRNPEQLKPSDIKKILSDLNKQSLSANPNLVPPLYPK